MLDFYDLTLSVFIYISSIIQYIHWHQKQNIDTKYKMIYIYIKYMKVNVFWTYKTLTSTCIINAFLFPANCYFFSNEIIFWHNEIHFLRLYFLVSKHDLTRASKLWATFWAIILFHYVSWTCSFLRIIFAFHNSLFKLFVIWIWFQRQF